MISTCVACRSGKENLPNPFFEEWTTPYGVPPFDRIRTYHYTPAFERAMSLHNEQIAALAAFDALAHEHVRGGRIAALGSFHVGNAAHFAHRRGRDDHEGVGRHLVGFLLIYPGLPGDGIRSCDCAEYILSVLREAEARAALYFEGCRGFEVLDEHTAVALLGTYGIHQDLPVSGHHTRLDALPRIIHVVTEGLFLRRSLEG